MTFMFVAAALVVAPILLAVTALAAARRHAASHGPTHECEPPANCRPGDLWECSCGRWWLDTADVWLADPCRVLL